jgi:hypothetical protein
MAPKERKFAGIFGEQLKAHQPGALAVAAPASTARAGKSSHPEYKKFTLVLKKHTQKQAKRLADDMEPRRDLSDVVQELLDGWIEKQQSGR